MTASQISKYKDIFCTSDTPLPELFQMMVENNCSCVTIVESLVHKNIIGAVTEHDICLKTIADGLNPQRISAGRVMNGNIVTINENANTNECSEILKKQNAARLFVIDDDGAFQGVLTEDDLKSATRTTEESFSDIRVLPLLSQKVRFAGLKN